MFDLTIKAEDGRILRRVEIDLVKPVRIGRGTDCDIRVAIPSVSRHHAELRPGGPSGVVIRDLGSTHGCLVAGRPIRELAVMPGLEVKLGAVTLRFDRTEDRLASEIAASIPDDDPDDPDTPPTIIGTADTQ